MTPPNAPEPAPFTGLRIVELAEGVAGPYCGKLLADLGADVIKVEPPAGDHARRANGADPEGSPLFLYCNTSKRGVVLDLNDEDDRAALGDLLRTADALVIDREPPIEIRPDLIVAAITPYGLSGPRSGAPAGELTLMHGGGLVNQMPARSRDIDRAPVALGGHRSALRTRPRRRRPDRRLDSGRDDQHGRAARGQRPLPRNDLVTGAGPPTSDGQAEDQ